MLLDGRGVLPRSVVLSVSDLSRIHQAHHRALLTHENSTIIPQDLSGPDSELRRLPAVDRVAHGDDGVEIHFAGNFSRPLGLNYTIFSYSCQFLSSLVA